MLHQLSKVEIYYSIFVHMNATVSCSYGSPALRMICITVFKKSAHKKGKQNCVHASPLSSNL